MSLVDTFRDKVETQISNNHANSPQELARMFGELYSEALQQHPNDIATAESILDEMFYQHIDAEQHQELSERYKQTKTYYNRAISGLSHASASTTPNESTHSTENITIPRHTRSNTAGATGELSYAPAGTVVPDTLDQSLLTNITLPTQPLSVGDSVFFTQYSQNTADVPELTVPEYNQRLIQVGASLLNIPNPTNHTITLLHTDADTELEKRTVHYLSQSGTPLADALAEIRDTFPLMIMVDDTDYSQSSYGPIDTPTNSTEILARAEQTAMTVMTSITGNITPEIIHAVRTNRMNPTAALQAVEGLSTGLTAFSGIADSPANIIVGLISQYNPDQITIDIVKQKIRSRLSGNGIPTLSPSGQWFGLSASYPDYYALNTVHHDYQQINANGVSTGGIATITLNPHMFANNYGMLEGVLLNEVSEIALLSKSDQTFTTGRMHGQGDNATIVYTPTTQAETQGYNPGTSTYHIRPDMRNIESRETNNPYMDAHAHPGYQLLGGMMDIQSNVNSHPSAEQMKGYVNNAREYYLWTYLSAGRGLAERYNFATEQETSAYALQFMRLTPAGANAAAQDLNRRAASLGLGNTVSFSVKPNSHTLGTIRNVMSKTVAHHLNTAQAGTVGGQWLERSVKRQNYLTDGSFTSDFGPDTTILGGSTLIATFTNPDGSSTQYDWLTGAIS